MFKKNCPKCEKKISRGFDYCPHCGNNFKSPNDKEDYGILGKNDFLEENLPQQIVEDSFMEKIFNTAVKMIEKQMRTLTEEMMENRNQPRPKNPNIIHPNLDIQFFVNGERVFPPNKELNKRTVPIQRIENDISKEKIDRISNLPKKEPESKVRRLSGKVVYELSVPGVKNMEDIFINQLENSIEIKALSKDKVYSKTLNINLPILRYKLNNGNLILELQER